MAAETGIASDLPEDYQWTDLMHKEGMELMTSYQMLLHTLGTEGAGKIKEINSQAQTNIVQPTHRYPSLR